MQTKKNILFYDTETSGLNPAFDQVLTFAAIRTDLNLNELSREEICVRLRPDIVPSPGAFLTHCLTPDILEKGIVEYEAAQKIHDLLNSPGTISCGYNSLGFDDEFLRFLFYRNLLDPYTHQYANGCSRMDMLPVTAIYRLFCDKALLWPVLNGNKPTLKLEHLSRENGFETSGNAHEAMSDVEALIALSRRFAREKKVWDYVLGFFDKAREKSRLASLSDAVEIDGLSFKCGLMVSPSFGAASNYIAPVLYIGDSIPYKNQTLWLRLDGEDLSSRLDTESNIYDVFVIRKRPGDQLFILPGYDRFWDKVTSGAKANFDRALAHILNHSDAFLATVAYFRAFKYPDIPDLDLDASLYQEGFFSPSEKKDILRFRELMHLQHFGEIAGLQSPRIREMAGRILFRNCDPQVCGPGASVSHLKRLAGRDSDPLVVGYKNDAKLTCSEAMAELKKIQSSADDSLGSLQRGILDWLNRHISDLAASFA